MTGRERQTGERAAGADMGLIYTRRGGSVNFAWGDDRFLRSKMNGVRMLGH
jgi:hypothetical protein